MGLLDKEPLEEGLKKSNSIALPEKLWEAIDAEVILERAKSRSALMTELLIWGIKELRKRRAEAEAPPRRSK